MIFLREHFKRFIKNRTKQIVTANMVSLAFVGISRIFFYRTFFFFSTVTNIDNRYRQSSGNASIQTEGEIRSRFPKRIDSSSIENLYKFFPTPIDHDETVPREPMRFAPSYRYV